MEIRIFIKSDTIDELQKSKKKSSAGGLVPLQGGEPRIPRHEVGNTEIRGHQDHLGS